MIKDRDKIESRLGYSIQGKRGGMPHIKDDVSSITMFIDNANGCQYGTGSYIKADAFSGFGDTFSRREMSEVSIVSDGNVIFKGDFTDLIEKLSK